MRVAKLSETSGKCLFAGAAVALLMTLASDFVPRVIHGSPLRWSGDYLMDFGIVLAIAVLAFLCCFRFLGVSAMILMIVAWFAALVVQVFAGYLDQEVPGKHVLINIFRLLTGVLLPALVGASTAIVTSRNSGSAAPPYRSKRQGLTLIELLVSVSIVVLLVALVLGVLASAKTEAKFTELGVKAQQINTALALYAQTNDDKYPRLGFDDLVAGGFIAGSQLVDSSDPFERGFGGQEVWCRKEPRSDVVRQSFESPVLHRDMSKSKAYLEELGGNFGLVALRTQGRKDSSTFPECGVSMAYSGRMLRVTLEGSLLRRNLIFDPVGTGLNFCPWDLFTDVRETCSYRIR